MLMFYRLMYLVRMLLIMRYCYHCYYYHAVLLTCGIATMPSLPSLKSTPFPRHSVFRHPQYIILILEGTECHTA